MSHRHGSSSQRRWIRFVLAGAAVGAALRAIARSTVGSLVRAIGLLVVLYWLLARF